MKRYKLNFDKSEQVFKTVEKYVKAKQCYNNTFEVVDKYTEKFQSGKWKVAYGYTSIMGNILCRHCFVVDENNDVIDVTIFKRSNPKEPCEYFAMKVFDDVNEYINAIDNENLYPALDKYLKTENQNAIRWATQRNYIILD